MSKQTETIICVGEILWDALPRGLFPGGAPLNVAHHLNQLGRSSAVLSAVGNDVLGQELVGRLKRSGIDTSMITVSTDLRTGFVDVELVDGLPAYRIVEGVAWDQLQPPEISCATASALVFGSLAQRTENNRTVLSALLEDASRTLKVFDVNLRFPFVDRDHVLGLAKLSDLVKVNDEEIAFLLQKSVGLDTLESAARELANISDTNRVCVTAGADGAGMLAHGSWTWVPTQPIEVRDTVGAGDAFLAAIVESQVAFDQVDLPAQLQRASKLAAFVASQDGPTPSYSVDSNGAFVATD